jgi:hypothetical protein
LPHNSPKTASSATATAASSSPRMSSAT